MLYFCELAGRRVKAREGGEGAEGAGLWRMGGEFGGRELEQRSRCQSVNIYRLP